jgi:hypothetical protein
MPRIRNPFGTGDEPTPETKPTGGPTGVPRPPAPKPDQNETVSLFKAPPRGMGECMYTHGFQASQFQMEGGDDSAYFTRDRSVAEKYAQAYGEGVIEVVMPKRDFDAKFARYEYGYDGHSTQVVIPASQVSQLNRYPRHWLK